MSQYFLTKVSGFTPHTYPVLGFTDFGARRNFLRNARPDHWIVYAGTKGRQTDPEKRGKLLGKVRLSLDTHVDTLDLLRSLGTQVPDAHWNPDGSYKWPFGLPIVEAQRFRAFPDTADVLGSYLSGPQWGRFALEVAPRLGRDRADRLAAILGEPQPLPESEEFLRVRRNHDVAMGVTGPPPSQSRRASVTPNTGGEVYLLELRGSDRSAYKIGYSSDTGRRARELNDGLVTPVTGLFWYPLDRKGFESSRAAYDLEQAIHAALSPWRVEGAREVYVGDVNSIREVWDSTLRNGDVS